jgi:hypothetical protein
MAQKSLLDLRVLSIENERMRILDTNMLIDKFTQKYARRSQKFK